MGESQDLLYYGGPMPPPERRHLRAGPLSLLFEGGDLRYVRYGEAEVLRRLYVAVRDRRWGTVTPVLSNLAVDAGPDSFEVTFDVEAQHDDIDFTWRGRITGDDRGTVTFTMDGVARSTFLSNRTGICVLHPVHECAGKPCRVQTVDGQTTKGAFPLHISPHQPFTDMRAIAHEVAPAVWAEVRFEGDIFEMEDQRNWTDASYKTYAPPLRLPYPVEIAAGTAIRQSVTLSLRGDVSASVVGPPAADSPVTFTIGRLPSAPLPQLGVSLGGHPLTPVDLERLARLGLSHLHLEQVLSEPGAGAVLDEAAAVAERLSLPLEIALVLGQAAEDDLRRLGRRLRSTGIDVRRWLIFHENEPCTTDETVALARRHLGDYRPAARFAGGSRANFTELNRGEPPLRSADLCYALNPQVHAFDNTSIVETLEGQAWTLAGAHRLAAGRPVIVSPITLKRRDKPGLPGGPAERPDLPPGADPRQAGLFAAAWTLGSLKQLAQGGAHSLTYYEATGPRGLMQIEPPPNLSYSEAKADEGVAFPVYHVLADACEMAGGLVVPSLSSDVSAVEGLMVRRGDTTRVMLANLTPRPRRVLLGDDLRGRALVRYLDETTFDQATGAPEQYRARPGTPLSIERGRATLDLLPYAVATVDLR